MRRAAHHGRVRLIEPAWVAAGLLAAGALQSATGFGFALIASPVLVGAYGGAEGISALTLISVAINLLTLATEGRRPVGDWRLAALLATWYIPGAVIGALVLRVVSQGGLEVLVAATVLGAIAVRLAPGGRQLRLPAMPAGTLAGVFGTSTGLSGPPLVLHLLHAGSSPLRSRDTLAAIFLTTALLSLGVLAVVGVLALPGDLGLLFAAPAVGHLLGRGVFARLGPVGYERVALATMGTSALASLALVVT